MAELRIALLGPPRVERDGTPIEVDTRKAIALLAYLAMQPERHGRDAVAGLLWPDYDTEHARGALRRTLSTLNKAVGPGWLAADRTTVGFARTSFWLDVAEFQALVAGRREHGHPPEEACPACVAPLAEAAGLHRGDFLAGFSLRDSTSFDDWQYFQAERLRRELAGTLERLATAQIGQHHWDDAVDAARRWLALDPLHEPAHRQLMRIYTWSGRRGAALRQFQACQRVLEDELGVEPLEETVAVHEAIQANRLPPPPEVTGAPAGAVGGSGAVDNAARPTSGPASVPLRGAEPGAGSLEAAPVDPAGIAGSAGAQTLLAVHEHLRQELDQLREVLRQVADGRATVAGARSHLHQMTMRQNYWAFGAFCASYCRVVTVHHAIEDAHLFRDLRRGDPSLEPVLERLSAEHEAIAALITGVDDALVAMIEDDDRLGEAEQAVDRLADALLPHLQVEEDQLLEPIARLGIRV
jgi:DNA-binding SARP family transcriptional activator